MLFLLACHDEPNKPPVSDSDDTTGPVECPALDVAPAETIPVSERCLELGVDPDPAVPDAWSARVLWQVASPAADPEAVWSYVTPLVAQLDDDDDDGDVDADDDAEIVAGMLFADVDGDDDTDEGRGWIVALDAATGAEKWAVDRASQTGGLAVADVDADGLPEVVGYDLEGRPWALAGEDGTVVWRATVEPSAGALYPLVSVADLDGDGAPEVLADDLVFDGLTGHTELALQASVSAPYRMAAVADVDLDGDQEIALAGKLYDSDGAVLWDSGEGGAYGMWPLVLQADADDEAEIAFVGQRYTLWEHDGTPIVSAEYGERDPNQPGPPCAGDFDGDGTVELVWPAYDTIVAYELDGSPIWSAPIDDESGLAGCSGFDVDADGALEVVFADQSTLRFLSGRDGAALYTEDRHRSGTVFEYPTVADVDHDGLAEVVLAGSVWDYQTDTVWAAVTVFTHDGAGWPTTNTAWPVHDFTGENVAPGGAVPASPTPAWLAGNAVRALPTTGATVSADLFAEVTDACVADCEQGEIALAVRVGNAGDTYVAAGVPLAVYALDGTERRLVRTVTLSSLPARAATGLEIALGPDDVGHDGWIVAIDPEDVVAECDEGDDEAAWPSATCP
jgi:hypothetical protein